MNSISYFEIQATDIEKVKNFYEQVFAWKFMEQVGMPVKYFRIETEGIAGGILQRPCKTPPMEYGTNAFTCSMQVKSFDEIASKILSSGGQVAMEKFAVAGKCWQGYFIDPDNNTFGIFEVDLNAK